MGFNAVRETCGWPAAIILVGLAWLMALAPGCGVVRSRQPVPPVLQDEARVAGMPDVRGYADSADDSMYRSAVESIRQELAAQPGKPAGVFLTDNVDILAVSGGGADGAFGAGLLCGWTEHGGRPRFKMVTGISTGSLIAPFAFLGPEWDAPLKEVYTTISTKNIYRLRNLLKMLKSDSIADTWPLAELATKYMDDSMLRAIAAEHQKGRRLFVGTTNLDTQRLTIWDMGAIAAIGTPEAYKLFRRILLASAAIPVMFPPIYLEVEASGKKYDEVHVEAADQWMANHLDSAFDLAILGDCLTHMPKSVGLDLLNALAYRAAYTLVVVPEFIVQGSVDGVAGEAHVSVWSERDLHWHDLWAWDNCRTTSFFLLRGYLPAPVPLADLVQRVNASQLPVHRSEERRVGKECRSRWSPYH